MIHFLKNKTGNGSHSASVFSCPFPHSSSPSDTRWPAGVFYRKIWKFQITNLTKEQSPCEIR